jgi:cytochrome P450
MVLMIKTRSATTMTIAERAQHGGASGAGVCPVPHGVGAWNNAPDADPQGPRVARDEAGVWQVRDHALVRQILRGEGTKQAGFNAELIERVPGTTNLPILYQEGKVHHEQRRQTARFFTPKTVSTRYRELMERLADRLIADFRRAGRADLSDISMQLAVAVAAEVVGLTDSALPGLDRRLDAFFAGNVQGDGGFWARLRQQLNRTRIMSFFYLDVKPAIRVRRRTPREDVISHLLGKEYNDAEILTECVTYAAAGMATTREFITVAAWHLLNNPELRERYLAAPEAERQDLLEEILRLEPVVGHLYRRTTDELRLGSGDRQVTIPAGELINLHIYAANRDEVVTGPQPEGICPGRALADKQSSPAMMSFGDGHHRCPGAYIAIQESDIFLRRLLALPGLKLEKAPTVTWDELTAGYILRDCIISDEPGAARRQAGR